VFWPNSRKPQRRFRNSMHAFDARAQL
jgi:hypothetical protein